MKSKTKIILPPIGRYSGPHPGYEFHISAAARKKYDCDEWLFSFSGNVILADFGAARQLAHEMNRAGTKITVGQLAAMGLIDELQHYVIAQYRARINQKVFTQALAHLDQDLSPADTSGCLTEFIKTFPPLLVHRRQITPHEYLKDSAVKAPHKETSLEEMLLLWVANQNPALEPFGELFGDQPLRQNSRYPELIEALKTFFSGQPGFGPFNQNLMELLLAPAKAHPHSLTDQLNYIKRYWLNILPAEILDRLFQRLLLALDIIKEEEKMRGGGPGPSPVLDFRRLSPGAKDGPDHEPKAFSPDLDWMPNVVMIAKNVPVWLFQLSQKYGFPITTLDQVPDRELELLARRGFNSLWLIGIWQRSPASRRIKQMSGNQEALASAYSLYDYSISLELGGDPAYWNLKERAQRYGIRLAVDMVPNHTGIYSRWVVEHPEWFIQTPQPPFPGYAFNGPDLSEDPAVGLFIEDGYWSRRDAAVVFKRVDRRSGEARYIYHGNDGTHLPWNDTAQLNFLLPAVREAVLGQILKVARYSSIIRFDAAMTLAKRHYQRLWFPEPGSGGDIPSRSGQGLSRQEFDRAFPAEFWRTVVDHIAREVPQTLLLAEAFWLMEGFFVRTLGMHRVYNSAFMNMLKQEENSNYRTVIKNVLEFNPEILKRFVNFVSNPDEEPAAVHFGKGDKYFGVCAMMSTLPGLPLFGHGQLEGFGEKYGMEYGRAYQNETEDQGLMERHQREIFPLLKKRYLFSGVEQFAFYDAVSDQGHIHSDIFAYSNGRGQERVLFIYNNRYQRAAGWIKETVRQRHDENDSFPSKSSLAQRLHLTTEGWYIFKDEASGLEYIKPAGELLEKGLYFRLQGYQYNLFSSFRKVDSEEYGRLCRHLSGRGVPDLGRALWELKLEAVIKEVTELFRPLAAADLGREYFKLPERQAALEQQQRAALKRYFSEAEKVNGPLAATGDIDRQAKDKIRLLSRLINGPDLKNIRASHGGRKYLKAVPEAELLFTLLNDAGFKFLYAGLLQNTLRQGLGDIASRELFGKKAVESLRAGGVNRDVSSQMFLLWENLPCPGLNTKTLMEDNSQFKLYLNRPRVQEFLGCNRYHDILWFNREKFLILLYWLTVISVVGEEPGFKASRRLLRIFNVALKYAQASEESGYDFNKFMSLI
ncbi:alpha-amylase [candidate division TA06 bacterium]|uniref:Alpha-amylase n=1 Tax=candidate division TA06 bacterium TaxID=2250710 RepID=A0A933MK79_UNCT6|nr:alpha-amylase [candidate division TA06 bacterium]